MSRYLVAVCLLILLLQIHLPAGEIARNSDSAVELNDLRKILQPAFDEQKKHLFTHSNSVKLIPYFIQSRWRNSIPEAVRILVASTLNEERKAGWDLASEHGAKMNWSESKIKSVILEHVEEVKITALLSIANTDVNNLAVMIEQILRSMGPKETCKEICTTLIDKVPQDSERVRLWLIACQDDSLRVACISVYHSVSNSIATTKVVCNWLNDKSTFQQAISQHHGRSTEVRTFACESLSGILYHQDETIKQIKKHCEMPPSEEDLEFFLTAMVTIHKLAPKSSYQIDQLKKWYEALPEKRVVFLDSIEYEFLDPDTINNLITSNIDNPDPIIRCSVCKCLLNRRIHDASKTLKKLFEDEHPGVRLAAVVAYAKIAPTFDLAEMRGQLLNDSAKFPKEFSIAFTSPQSAIAQLALAGQSDEKAIHWLKQHKSPELRTLCHEAIKELTDKDTDSPQYIPWR